MIVREDRDGVRILRLAHGKVSAMDIELGEALIAELKAAAGVSVRAVVVTGTGSSFSAGVDLFRLIKDGPAYGERFLPVLDTMLRDALTFPKPLIAAVRRAGADRISGMAAVQDGCGRRRTDPAAPGVPFDSGMGGAASPSQRFARGIDLTEGHGACLRSVRRVRHIN